MKTKKQNPPKGGTLTEEQAEEVLVKRRAYADRIDKVEDEFKKPGGTPP